jgi:hypothetical protein
MKVSQDVLINKLVELTRACIIGNEKMMEMPLESLQRKASPESWSALECIEHLNRYGHFYLPEINRVLNQNKKGSAVNFKSGLIGNYFAKSMQVKPKLNKMKTFKSMNPIHSELDKTVIQEFLDQQKELLVLLNKSRLANLTKLKTNISISKQLKLRLGDKLRVVVFHNDRHLAQAMKSIG